MRIALWITVLTLFSSSAQTAEGRQATANDRVDLRLQARRSPVVEVFEACRDAVVNISCTEIVEQRDPFGMGSIFEDFFQSPRGPRGGGGGGGTRQFTRNSVGSGFVIHPDGYIVTNAHVVAQTAERKVGFADGRAYDAQIIAFDTNRDLAILKITADAPLPVIKMGRSHDLLIGETVIAIGNPVGLQNTVTAGVISAVDRTLDFPNGMALKGLVQTDASINPGNSGGPLLNVLGELIGVNSAIRGDAQNIGFAIPVDQLRELLPELLDVERRYRVESGLIVDQLGSPRVISVAAGSAAERAGLKLGDVLQRVNDRAIHEGIDWSIALIGAQPGQAISIAYLRDGQPGKASLSLDAKPAPDGLELARTKFGVEIVNLPPDAAASLGLPEGVGLLVTQVEPDSPAAQSGLQRRDVLMALGRHTVANTDDLGQLLEQVKPGERVPVTVLRVDRRMKLRLSGEVTTR